MIQFHYINMRKKQLVILTALAVVFFFVYSYLNFAVPASIFNSPDETSAYFFSKLFAETGRLSQIEPLDFLAPYLIHPRSVYVQNGYLAPGGFLGMPLVYGSLAKVFLFDFGNPLDSRNRTNPIPFFTPLFAVFGVIAFYFLLRKIWGENMAFLGAVLMFFLPPFWYYSTRGMFPNVLFAVCLIFSAFFFFVIPLGADGAGEQCVCQIKRWREYLRYFGGGLFLGLALITRTSEIVWLGILGLALAIYFVKKIYWPAAILGFAALCAVFIPVFWQNQMLYGSFLESGYNVSAIGRDVIPSEVEGSHAVRATDEISPLATLGRNDEVVRRSSAIKNIFSVVQRFVLPFGIHPRAVWQNFWNYFIKFFWWFTIPMILGCLIFLYNLFKRRVLEKEIIYFLSFIFISGWLLIYYGGWQFSDNINWQKITIGNSYLRYWLLIFIVGLPFVVVFFRKFLSLFKTKYAKAAVLVSLLIFTFSASAISVFAGEDEGIFYVKNQLLRYNEVKQAALKLTEENSIIITERSDKIFFPDRRIIVWNRGEALGENFKNLSKFAPLYYYNVAFTNEEFRIMNQGLKKMGLTLNLVKIFGNEGLYKIIFNF